MEKEGERGRGVIEEYKVKTDDLVLNVSILGGKGLTKSYFVAVPNITTATRALMDHIKQGLVNEIAISNKEILDPNSITILKERFSKKAKILLKTRVTSMPDETINFLVNVLIQEMLGLGEIEYLLNDANLEEIVITSCNEPVRVYHKVHGWLETNIIPKSEDQILNYANIIGRRVGRQITALTPLLDAHLVTGDRANAVLFPISTKGHTITIRKFSRDPWTLVSFCKNKTVTPEVLALVWLSIQYEMNVLISGGTASGKTSFLNICMPFIPPNQRIVSIEDTRELQLPKFLYWCPLTVRQPNPEGKGEVSMLDLLINSLRMRPDRIILGEMRRKDQAEVLFEAMHTGHSVCATVHADSIQETIQRLVNPPIEVPKNLLSGVNLNVVMFRDRRSGKRRTLQVGEFVPSMDELGSTVKPHMMYRWKPVKDEIVETAAPVRLYSEIARLTGMSLTDINKDLLIKQNLIKWMMKKDYKSVDEVGSIIRRYYSDPKSVIDNSGAGDNV
ncbi:MAG: ATPase, T2SS/T4P/T4SS family [Nanoarchaeota archaeon]|nr:ATPase, T2SS/T4P/T4SS family [Nanoarchaeota archaeon]